MRHQQTVENPVNTPQLKSPFFYRMCLFANTPSDDHTLDLTDTPLTRKPIIPVNENFDEFLVKKISLLFHLVVR